MFIYTIKDIIDLIIFGGIFFVIAYIYINNYLEKRRKDKK